MFEIKQQKGIALYYSVMVITILLAIALGLNTIFLGQVKTVRTTGYSVLAFYAADTGIEEILENRTTPNSICTELSPCTLANNTQYFLVIENPGSTCSADNYCVTSVGICKEVRTGIEITY